MLQRRPKVRNGMSRENSERHPNEAEPGIGAKRRSSKRCRPKLNAGKSRRQNSSQSVHSTAARELGANGKKERKQSAPEGRRRRRPDETEIGRAHV